MSVQIEKDQVVSINYVLTDDEGQQIDSSAEAGPMTYIHGAGAMIPGLEAELTGKAVGDKFTASIAPVDAYGERDDEYVQQVPRALFEGVEEIEPGMQFQAQSEQGMQMIRVLAVEGDEITIDNNHPLAGITLNFEVEVTEVRAATEDELSHGHVHSASCNH